MDDAQLAEACRLQAEQTDLGPALILLQQRGQLGATLIAVAQSLGISQSQLQEPIAETGVSHRRALIQRLAEARIPNRQQGMEPAIYFAPPPREPQRPLRPKPQPTASARPFSPPRAVAPPAPSPKPQPAAEERPPVPAPPLRPRLSLNVSLAIELDRAGQVVVSSVRLTGPDAASYKILAQPQDESISADGILRSLGVIVELEHR